MRNNVPHKRWFPPDYAWCIWEYKHIIKRNRHYNCKRFFVNVFNRRLRRFFKKKMKDDWGI